MKNIIFSISFLLIVLFLFILLITSLIIVIGWIYLLFKLNCPASIICFIIVIIILIYSLYNHIKSLEK